MSPAGNAAPAPAARRSPIARPRPPPSAQTVLWNGPDRGNDSPSWPSLSFQPSTRQLLRVQIVKTTGPAPAPHAHRANPCPATPLVSRSEEHTSELQSHHELVC